MGALLTGTHPAIAQPVNDPLAPNRLPGALTETRRTIPTLAFAAVSTKSVPVLATPAGALPSVEFEVVTTGGAAPVNFSIAGGAAAPYFEIVAPASPTPTRVPTAAELAAAQAEARLNPTAAGTITRKVRFKGTASAAGLPSALPVQIRATDVLGSTSTSRSPPIPSRRASARSSASAPRTRASTSASASRAWAAPTACRSIR